MKSVTKIFVVLLSFLAISGCASFRGGQIGEIQNWPPTANQKLSIAYTVKGTSNVNGAANQIPDAGLTAFKEQVQRAYTDSDLFSQVTEGKGNADIVADIELVDVGTGSMFLAFMSGFTFGVIPAYANDEFSVRTVFKDKDGNRLGEILKKEDVSLWMHILMLPATPFMFPLSVVKDAHYDLNRATLVDADQKNIL